MEDVLTVIMPIILYSYTILSSLAFIYFLLKNPKIFTFSYEPYRHPPWFLLPMWIGVFVTLTYVLSVGFNDFLKFIPYSWGGYDEDGDWYTVRFSIAVFLAFFTAGYFLYLVGEFQRIKEEKRSSLSKNKRIKRWLGKSQKTDTSRKNR